MRIIGPPKTVPSYKEEPWLLPLKSFPFTLAGAIHKAVSYAKVHLPQAGS